MKSLASAIGVLCALISGCTSMGQVGREASGPQDGESIVVIGVSSPNFRVFTFSGTIVDGRFRQGGGPTVISGTARDGYLVGKASSGQLLGITVVEFLNSPDQLLGSAFYACRDARAMVFEMPPRGVYYLGDLDYTVDGKSLRIAYSQRIGAARTHLREFFPRLTGELRPLDHRLLPTIGGYCSQTIYIPIYIGR